MNSLTYPKSLRAIAAAESSANAATGAVRLALEQNPRSGDEIYRAFRAWTWKVLTQRRYDAELSKWFDLFSRTEAVLNATRQAKAANQISSLRDLVFESIQFGEYEPVERVLQRAHVATILHTMRRRGTAARSTLASATGQKDPNLSRVLALLQSTGLIERDQAGKEAIFTLTQAGLKACRKLPAGRPSYPVATQPSVRRRAARHHALRGPAKTAVPERFEVEDGSAWVLRLGSRDTSGVASLDTRRLVSTEGYARFLNTAARVAKLTRASNAMRVELRVGADGGTEWVFANIQDKARTDIVAYGQAPQPGPALRGASSREWLKELVSDHG